MKITDFNARAARAAGETTRRSFLHAAAALATATMFPVDGIAKTSKSYDKKKPAHLAQTANRAERVFKARMAAAEAERKRMVVPPAPNGDDARYAARWASHTKCMPHNGLGEVDATSYNTYLRAIESGDPAVFEQIPLAGYLKLGNPQAAFAIDLIGPDAATLALATPPRFDSAEQAGELAEMYWHALLRDIPFGDYATDPTVTAAAAELTSLEGFTGPRDNGKVTHDTLFRGPSAGGRRGPYVSQFLVRDIPLSPIRVPNKIRTATPQRDYMTRTEDWLAMQNGQLAGVNTFEDGPRYIRNGRDLGEFVHRDFTYQAGLCACMMLLKMSAPLDGGIPYQYSITQGGFVTFGPSDIFHLVSTVANGALKAAWYQKWLVHRRGRPEEIAGRLHYHLAGKKDAPLHADIFKSEALKRTKDRTGSWLLPQAYPEGAPAHPSYPAGHAVIAGACSTVLKAVFAESWVLPGNMQPTKDGLSIEPYKGVELTVGDELDKLAENIAIGRNFAGIHWRSDGVEGIKLGEDYAIAYLREMKLTSSEFFHGFSLTKFDGTRITV
jgi:hypothetical protein